jgi:hypothetical protein
VTVMSTAAAPFCSCSNLWLQLILTGMSAACWQTEELLLHHFWVSQMGALCGLAGSCCQLIASHWQYQQKAPLQLHTSWPTAPRPPWRNTAEASPIPTHPHTPPHVHTAADLDAWQCHPQGTAGHTKGSLRTLAALASTSSPTSTTRRVTLQLVCHAALLPPPHTHTYSVARPPACMHIVVCRPLHLHKLWIPSKKIRNPTR